MALGAKKVVALITARGGSKGLPRKNVLPCAGQPLIAWTIAAARSAPSLDRAILSTDDPEIIEVARAHGGDVPFVRPAELATDEAAMDGVVMHALDALAAAGEHYDVGVLLQATSPLRRGEDIEGALATMTRMNAVSVVSVTAPSKSPFWMYRTAENGRLVSLFPDLAQSPTRRQELAQTWVLNGAVYVFDVAWFRQHRRFTSEESVPYVMPQDRSADVDTALDLAMANILLRGAGT